MGRQVGREPAADAARRLFEDYADDVYQYVRFTLGNAADAEDVVQEVFLEVVRGWLRFGGRSSEKTWLWSIARHRLVDSMRRNTRGELLSEGLPASTVSDVATRVDLERCLQRLSLAQRQVFVLRIIQDRPTAETARLLGWSGVRVRVTLHRALSALGPLMRVDDPPVAGKGAPR